MKIGLMEIKQALKDPRFVNTLPEEFSDDIRKYQSQPGCGPCNTNLYRKVLSKCGKQLQAYFPNREIADITEEIKKLSENHWKVINCNVSDLESELKKLSPGRKQVAMARFQDQVTVIIDELEVLY